MKAHRKTRPAALLVGVLPLLLGGSLAGYSPITCGCIDTWYGLALSLDLKAKDWHQVTPAAIASGFDAKLRGKVVSLSDLPMPESEMDCVARSGSGYRCVYWLWRNGPLQRGVRVDIGVTSEGKYTAVHVAELTRRVA